MVTNVPRTKDKEERQAEIERAAKEVFLSRGYQSASVQEIAKKAGIGKGTVYLYYKSKEDLYTALILPSIEYANSKFQTLLEAVDNKMYGSAGELLEAFADLLVNLHYWDPGMGIIYQTFQIGSSFNGLSGDTFDHLSRAGKTNFQTMRKIISSAMEQGLIQRVDVVKTVDALWGTYVGVAQVEWHKLRWTRKDHLRETLHHAFSLVGTGLCRRQAGEQLVVTFGEAG
jgi:AcrR family transcriptional regulator